MTTRAAFRGPDGHLVDVSERIRKYRIDVTENAEEMDSAQSTIVLDDPLGDLDLHGFRIFTLWEDEVPGDDKHFYVGYVGQQRIRRGPYRTGVSREWEIDLHDINSIFERRVLYGDDANRPAETDVERVTWWAGSTFGSLIDDERYLFSDDPVAMDANDYRLQNSDALLRDCMMAGSKNLYASYSADLYSDVDNPWGNFWIWFGPSNRDEYVAAVGLSNVLAEFDPDAEPRAFFEVLQQAVETQNPDRIYSRVFVPYKQSYAMANRDQTATDFALSGRDAVMPSLNINTKAKAQARANVFVNTLKDEQITAELDFFVPRSQVNDVRPGMLVAAHLTHLPHFTDTPFVRVMSRAVSQLEAEDYYRIHLLVELPDVPPTPAPTSAILYRSDGPHDAVIWWDASGDNPEAGLPSAPTQGLIEILDDTGSADRPYRGFKITGTGTIDVEMYATVVGVLVGTYTLTYAICVNGSVVASEAQIVSGSLQYLSTGMLVVANGLAVSPDDEVTATLTCEPPTLPFFGTPAGAGQNNERFVIVGGSLS